MSFGDVLWLIIISFAFFAYLMILFSIIGDLVRDSESSGWAKAGWVILLFIFPLLTALVYFIVRGGGMAERAAKQQREVQAQTVDLIHAASGGGQGAADQIAKAKALLDSGAISQAEYDALKAKALA